MSALIPQIQACLVRCRNRRISIEGKKCILKISVTLVLLVSMIVAASIAATPPVRAYPSEALFTKQINQTSGAIINYRQPSEIQKYINDDPNNIEQVLQQLVWQIYRTSNHGQTSQVVNEINRQVAANPEGFTGDSIFWFGYRTANGQTHKVIQVIGQVSPPPAAVQSIVSFNNLAINDATYLGDGAQRFFQGVQAVIIGNPQTAGFSQSSSATGNSGGTSGGNGVDIASGNGGGATGGDATRQVFGQIILDTALEGGQVSAQQALINLVNPLVNNPTGSLSKAIFLIASVQASGNIVAANNAVKAVADHLASGGSVKKIPQIVDSILVPGPPSHISSHHSNTVGGTVGGIGGGVALGAHGSSSPDNTPRNKSFCSACGAIAAGSNNPQDTQIK